MSIMETTVSQFGAAFGGAAGPIRSVASRTADLVPTAARVAEMLNPNLDLRDRVGRLTIRLTYGIPAIAVELAREAGSQLLRGDYCALALQCYGNRSRDRYRAARVSGKQPRQAGRGLRRCQGG
jgi:hypothetical protein